MLLGANPKPRDFFRHSSENHLVCVPLWGHNSARGNRADVKDLTDPIFEMNLLRFLVGKEFIKRSVQAIIIYAIRRYAKQIRKGGFRIRWDHCPVRSRQLFPERRLGNDLT